MTELTRPEITKLRKLAQRSGMALRVSHVPADHALHGLVQLLHRQTQDEVRIIDPDRGMSSWYSPDLATAWIVARLVRPSTAA